MINGYVSPDRVIINPLNLPEGVIHAFQTRVKNSFLTGCWEWTGYISPNGYGGGVGGRESTGGKHKNSHQLSWLIYNGEIPLGMVVCHKCDNRSCCNPDHLFLGTQMENIHDMISKGRGKLNKGESNPQAKLKASDVSRLVEEGYSKKSCKEWAQELGVSRTAISQIVHRKRWNND